MSEKTNFRKQFFKDRKMIGSMTPSSRFLTNKMLDHVDFKSGKVFIELGPGTGVFTEEILKRMRPDAHLLVFELNNSFYDDLNVRLKDDRLHLIHDSAEKMEEYLHQFQLERPDSIISSLPLAVFTPELRASILKKANEVLSPKGNFIQFQYTLQAKKELRKLYNSVSISFTPFNIPPAFIYTCKK